MHVECIQRTDVRNNTVKKNRMMPCKKVSVLKDTQDRKGVSKKKKQWIKQKKDNYWKIRNKKWTNASQKKPTRRLPRTQKLIERPTNLFLELDRAPKKTLECKKKRTKSKGPKKEKLENRRL